MSIVIEPTSDRATAIVRAGKALDFRNANAFKNACLKQIDAGVLHFIIDFSEAAILDSTALGALFSVYRQISPKDGQLVFVGVTGAVRMVVEMTRLSKVFGQYPTVEAARRALSSSAS